MALQKTDHSRSPIPPVAGIGLRARHHEDFLELQPAVGWVEAHSENYLNAPAISVLEAVRENYPVSLHSVGLSLGSAEGLNLEHLADLNALAARIEPGLISEHLAWGAVNHEFLADLLPLPLTEESLEIVSQNILRAQDAFRRPILIENPATYLQFNLSSIPETEFLSALVERTGCGLICDINNIFVSSFNHKWDALAYLHALPKDAIGEYHLAGHLPTSDEGALFLLDSHDRQVAPSVWTLFESALRIIGPRPTLIEWDAEIPGLQTLLQEADEADQRLDRHSADCT